MDRKHYDRYKNLLGKLNYSYKGYDLKSLIPGYLTSVFSDDPRTVRDVFKEFYLTTRLFDFHKVFEIKSSTIISYFVNRSDYKELAIATQQMYPDSEVINIETLPFAKYSSLSISYWFHLLKALRIVFFASLNETLIMKLFLVALITRIFNNVSALEQYEISKTTIRYICFNTAYKDESLLTLYFQKRGVETITLQHGIFCDFKMMIPFDCINFENLIADKILCWGQSTIDYLEERGLDRSRLILSGNPKYSGTVIEQIDQSFKRCLVLLGRQVYVETNDKLLNLLKTYNLKSEHKILFYIKKHPFLMDDDHKSFADISNQMIFLGKEHSVQEIMRSELVDFSIAVNTTAYYESLALGKISLRWSESENEDFYGMDDKFFDLQGFEKLIENYKKMPESEVKGLMTNVIKYVFNPNIK